MIKDEINEYLSDLEEIVKCIKSQGVSYNEFKEYNDWFIELIANKAIPLDNVREFGLALKNVKIVDVNKDDVFQLNIYREKISLFLSLTSDKEEMVKKDLNRDNIVSICDSIEGLYPSKKR